jgi:hypothetical protein
LPCSFSPNRQSQKYALGLFKKYATELEWSELQAGMKGSDAFACFVGPAQFKEWAFNASDGATDEASREDARKKLSTAVAAVRPKEKGRW